MTSSNTLEAAVAALDQAGIPHMLAGSFASSLHGLARTTADIDLVIDPPPGAIDRFVEAIDRDRYYVDESSARTAVDDQSQFNVIDTHTGWKIDMIVRKSRPFSIAEFNRRLPATVIGVPVFVATAEDTILAKLEWALIGGSERQLHDVIEILRIRRSDLDSDYLDRWAQELGVSALLAQARANSRGE